MSKQNEPAEIDSGCVPLLVSDGSSLLSRTWCVHQLERIRRRSSMVDDRTRACCCCSTSARSLVARSRPANSPVTICRRADRQVIFPQRLQFTKHQNTHKHTHEHNNVHNTYGALSDIATRRRQSDRLRRQRRLARRQIVADAFESLRSRSYVSIRSHPLIESLTSGT